MEEKDIKININIVKYKTKKNMLYEGKSQGAMKISSRKC